MTDRYSLTVRALLGAMWPALPALPGRVHRLIDDDPAPDELAGLTAIEIAQRVGITRQGAAHRIQRATETGDWSGLLAPKLASNASTRQQLTEDRHG